MVFNIENALKQICPNSNYLIALDEVGRGCMAGPVVTCASLWQISIPELDSPQKKWLPLVRDSKKLSATKREKVFHIFKESNADFTNLSFSELIHVGINTAYNSKDYQKFGSAKNSTLFHPTESEQTASTNKSFTEQHDLKFLCAGIGAATAAEVDELNIWNAVQLAMNRSIDSVLTKINQTGIQPILLLDGNRAIRVPKTYALFPQFMVIGGDDLCPSVGISSIVAKVIRDGHMDEISNLHPQYQFAKHKGYGTAIHRQAIQKHGPCPEHRRSFLGNLGFGLD